MDVLHIFHTKCLIARTRRVSSVLTYRWRLYMITTTRCPALVLGTFWGSAKRQRRDIFNYLLFAYSPSKARLVYIAELKAKLGESKFFKESSKRSINPGSGTVFDMWTKYCKRFGSACLNLVNADTIFALSILDCVFLPTETDLCLWIILFYWDPKLSLSPALAVLKGTLNIIMMNQYRSL